MSRHVCAHTPYMHISTHIQLNYTRNSGWFHGQYGELPQVLACRLCGQLPFHQATLKRNWLQRLAGKWNDFQDVFSVIKTEFVATEQQKLIWLVNNCSPLHRPIQFETSLRLICESYPLIFLVYGAPRWVGWGWRRVTSHHLGKFHMKEKKERLKLFSIKQWKHYKVIGSD